jgi:hypothetical protein
MEAVFGFLYVSVVVFCLCCAVGLAVIKTAEIIFYSLPEPRPIWWAIMRKLRRIL